MRLYLRWLHTYALSQELRVNSFEDGGPLLSRCGSLTDSFAGAGMTLAKGILPKKGNSRSLCMDTVSVRAVAPFGQASGHSASAYFVNVPMVWFAVRAAYFGCCMYPASSLHSWDGTRSKACTNTD